MTVGAQPIAAQPITGSREAPIIERVIDTDRIYFELGAEIRQLPGATLAWTPGLAGAAAGAVIHRADADMIAAGGAPWLAKAEAALGEAGAQLARIYLDCRGTAADALLATAGYTARDEIAFIHDFAEQSPMVTLVPVHSDEDWRRKLALHKLCEGSPDGHGTEAGDWVALERAKCAHGMEMFLAECDGQIVGTAGLIAGEGVLRIKNLVVHPGRRRHRFGAAILAQMAAIGRLRGLPTLGLFAVAGEDGELLYRAVGMSIAGTQVEWSRPLGRQAR